MAKFYIKAPMLTKVPETRKELMTYVKTMDSSIKLAWMRRISEDPAVLWAKSKSSDWMVRVITEARIDSNVQLLIACDIVERFLWEYESAFPCDNRIRNVVHVCRQVAAGNVPMSELKAATAMARDICREVNAMIDALEEEYHAKYPEGAPDDMTPEEEAAFDEEVNRRIRRRYELERAAKVALLASDIGPRLHSVSSPAVSLRRSQDGWRIDAIHWEEDERREQAEIISKRISWADIVEGLQKHAVGIGMGFVALGVVKPQEPNHPTSNSTDDTCSDAEGESTENTTTDDTCSDAEGESTENTTTDDNVSSSVTREDFIDFMSRDVDGTIDSDLANFRSWVEEQDGTPEELWKKCRRPEWLLALAIRAGVDDNTLRFLATQFAGRALSKFQHKDGTPTNEAVEVARLHANNLASDDELKAMNHEFQRRYRKKFKFGDLMPRAPRLAKRGEEATFYAAWATTYDPKRGAKDASRRAVEAAGYEALYAAGIRKGRETSFTSIMSPAMSDERTLHANLIRASIPWETIEAAIKKSQAA